MPRSPFRLLKNALVLRTKSEISRIGALAHGIYFLYQEDHEGYKNVVYVGKASSGEKNAIRARLMAHKRSKKRWTHFSAYEFWDNITESEITEVEALFLTAYADDANANKHNVQRGNKQLRILMRKTAKEWTQRPKLPTSAVHH